MVPQYEFEKGTSWRDGFWRYARFKNMPFFLGSDVRGGGGGGRYIWVYKFYSNYAHVHVHYITWLVKSVELYPLSRMQLFSPKAIVAPASVPF